MSNCQIDWEPDVRKTFDLLIDKIPVFMRSLAREKVLKRVEKNVRADMRSKVNEKDMVNAFFEATPFGFHGPMKLDMEELGIDYLQYGHS